MYEWFRFNRWFAIFLKTFAFGICTKRRGLAVCKLCAVLVWEKSAIRLEASRIAGMKFPVLTWLSLGKLLASRAYQGFTYGSHGNRFLAGEASSFFHAFCSICHSLKAH